MRKIKRIITFVLALCMCFGTSAMSVFAAETDKIGESSSVSSFDCSNFDFPEGSEVLYQRSEGVVYITNSDNSIDSDTSSTRSMEYNQVWIDKDKYKTGSFTVPNPHRLAGDANGTLKLESEASEVKMDVVVSVGTTTVLSRTISANQEIHFSYNSFASEVVIHYYVNTKSRLHGMRLNCWVW